MKTSINQHCKQESVTPFYLSVLKQNDFHWLVIAFNNVQSVLVKEGRSLSFFQKINFFSVFSTLCCKDPIPNWRQTTLTYKVISSCIIELQTVGKVRLRCSWGCVQMLAYHSKQTTCLPGIGFIVVLRYSCVLATKFLSLSTQDSICSAHQ